MTLANIVVLALIQGAAELLPVSSSAHVILAEKLMGLDPGAPEMTFLLVMLHTGTMFAVLVYFWKRWLKLLSTRFIRMVAIATACTGLLGLALKKVIEKLVLAPMAGGDKAEIEHLFRNLPLMGTSLLAAGLLIVLAGSRESRAARSELESRDSAFIGVIQGLCLPFRGFSRSGATISTALLRGVDRALAEEFSFALAVVLTPAVIALELHRLYKSAGAAGHAVVAWPSLIGMAMSFVAGLAALRWLSAWLENGRWKLFGYYCFGASAVVFAVAFLG